MGDVGDGGVVRWRFGAARENEGCHRKRSRGGVSHHTCRRKIHRP